MAHNICVDDQNSILVKLGRMDRDDSFIKEVLSEGQFKETDGSYTYSTTDRVKFDKTIRWVVEYFTKEFRDENVEVCPAAMDKLKSVRDERDMFDKANALGLEIKEKNKHDPDLPDRFKRRLMDYQKMSVEHMIRVGNAANFSVPGSGKTTITYAAISKWMEDGIVEKILVIGPTSSFLPWEEEYEGCFGTKPRSRRVSGDMSGVFHEIGESYDLFLMHFNTAMNRTDELKDFMNRWKTVLIIDESHYIKNPNLRKWGSMAIGIAPYAKRRIVLSGTPMPNNAKDLWTQITFLWPHDSPLDGRESYIQYAKRSGIGKYSDRLNRLFCRIKKNDLDLPKPEWIRKDVPLGNVQKRIYDAIAAKTLKELDEITWKDQSRLQKFRIARMVRMLQTASNPTLLKEFSSTFDVTNDRFADMFGEAFGMPPDVTEPPNIGRSLMDEINNYTTYEIPSKIVAVSELARDLVHKGNKVIIWSTFIHNMDVLKHSTRLENLKPIIINGNVPREGRGVETRDELINRFKNDDESMVLIASPSSIGESVSLHKNSSGKSVCNHAIYLDRNFNGAQYMQSMDRIHRIGMDRSVRVKYHLFVAQGTIDEAINKRLREKQEDMLNALNDDMLESLDINPKPQNINNDELDRDYQAMVAHLRQTSRR